MHLFLEASLFLQSLFPGDCSLLGRLSAGPAVDPEPRRGGGHRRDGEAALALRALTGDARARGPGEMDPN